MTRRHGDLRLRTRQLNDDAFHLTSMSTMRMHNVGAGSRARWLEQLVPDRAQDLVAQLCRPGAAVNGPVRDM